MKKFIEIYEGIKKVDVVQRKKMARRMAKMAKSATFQRKKEKARRFCLLLLQPPRALAHESESERQNK